MKIKMAAGNISCFFVLFLTALIADEVFCQKVPALSAKPPKGRVSLLNSYMPAAMQVLAHLTNQMMYDAQPSTTKPPVAVSTTVKATTTTQTTTTQATTSSTASAAIASLAGDEMQPTTSRLDQTTQTHRPAIFAPIPPAKPQIINGQPLKTNIDEEVVVPPIIEGASYGGAILIPYETSIPLINHQNPIPAVENFPVLYQANPYVYVRSPEAPDTLFLPTDYQPEQFDPIARSGDDEEDKYPDISSLPVENENNFKYNPLEIEPDELSEENLQYLSNDVRNILRMERDFKIEKWTDASAFQTTEELFDDVHREQSGDLLRLTKSPTQSMIQMLLLYDLFSRDAKKQKLNNYHGYSEDMIKDLIETSKGTAIDQLKTVLERMLAKGDCTYDFANNRAKEMVKQLEKPDSRISNEIRYLEPLRYTE